MKKCQIGVIGSMADTKLQGSLVKVAEEVGKEIVENDAVLLFGFEADFDSLPMIAARSAEDAGGKTIAFLYGSEKIKLSNLKSKTIITGLSRGGGREFLFVKSCDVIISIAGGSGTLMEIAMAYQARIPVVALQNSGGWSAKLANKFLDGRKRQKIIGVNTAKEAIRQAVKLTKRL